MAQPRNATFSELINSTRGQLQSAATDKLRVHGILVGMMRELIVDHKVTKEQAKSIWEEVKPSIQIRTRIDAIMRKAEESTTVKAEDPNPKKTIMDALLSGSQSQGAADTHIDGETPTSVGDDEKKIELEESAPRLNADSVSEDLRLPGFDTQWAEDGIPDPLGLVPLMTAAENRREHVPDDDCRNGWPHDRQPEETLPSEDAAAFAYSDFQQRRLPEPVRCYKDDTTPDHGRIALCRGTSVAEKGDNETDNSDEEWDEERLNSLLEGIDMQGVLEQQIKEAEMEAKSEAKTAQQSAPTTPVTSICPSPTLGLESPMAAAYSIQQEHTLPNLPQGCGLQSEQATRSNAPVAVADLLRQWAVSCTGLDAILRGQEADRVAALGTQAQASGNPAQACNYYLLAYLAMHSKDLPKDVESFIEHDGNPIHQFLHDPSRMRHFMDLFPNSIPHLDMWLSQQTASCHMSASYAGQQESSPRLVGANPAAAHRAERSRSPLRTPVREQASVAPTDTNSATSIENAQAVVGGTAPLKPRQPDTTVLLSYIATGIQGFAPQCTADDIALDLKFPLAVHEALTRLVNFQTPSDRSNGRRTCLSWIGAAPLPLRSWTNALAVSPSTPACETAATADQAAVVDQVTADQVATTEAPPPTSSLSYWGMSRVQTPLKAGKRGPEPTEEATYADLRQLNPPINPFKLATAFEDLMKKQSETQQGPLSWSDLYLKKPADISEPRKLRWYFWGQLARVGCLVKTHYLFTDWAAKAAMAEELLGTKGQIIVRTSAGTIHWMITSGKICSQNAGGALMQRLSLILLPYKADAVTADSYRNLSGK